MKKVSRLERRIACDRVQLHEGIPWIEVVADGGWSHRSHGHTYSAKSGVGVIFGRVTGLLFFIGVRNKYCFICSGAKRVKEAPKLHCCFLNWNKSNKEME